MTSMKVIKCIKCKVEKSEDSFSIFHGRRNKWCTKCREVNNTWYAQDIGSFRTKAKEYYKSNFKRIKSYRFSQAIKKKYGITLDQFNYLVEVQDNKCAICEKEFDRKSKDRLPHIDHDHVTLKVRGLLCINCNMRLIPSMEKYTHLFEKAKSYLSQ